MKKYFKWLSRTTIGSIVALFAIMAMFLIAGCSEGNHPIVPPNGTLPKFYIQATQNVVVGPWPALPITYSDNGGGAATVAAGKFVRVMVDSGTVHNLTVLSSVTGKEDPYIAGTWLSLPAGDYKFLCSVTKPGADTDLVLVLTITPTQLTDFRVVALAGSDYMAIVPDELNIARLPEGVEVSFWVGGTAYPLGTTGTRGGFGGINGSTITGSFWTIEGEGGKFLPVTIPFTQGDSCRLYHPANGEYIVVASFPFEGQTMTTAPLHFTVGAWTPPQ